MSYIKQLISSNVNRMLVQVESCSFFARAVAADALLMLSMTYHQNLLVDAEEK